MEIKEKPPDDFFKGIKTSLKSVLKHPDINLPKILFKKVGFQTYLVDEFRTSCMCSKCEVGVCKKTMVWENPKPYRSGNVLLHGLICCKNGCGYWNRDVNGATNIYKIAYNAINNKERPNYLSRSNKSSGSLDELPKPKFTRSVKSKPF